MKKEKALEVFDQYVNLYDVTDIKIKLKIDHTYRVAEIAEKIGGSVGADPDFSWFLGLLHDIGRFEQLKRYQTFIDRDSVDHAELGADILFSDGMIDAFPVDAFMLQRPGDDKYDAMHIIETVIRLHNKLELPSRLDDTTLLYCRILRDADKVDIMRVLTEPPYDERNERIVKDSGEGRTDLAGEDVMRCVQKHCCVPRSIVRTDFESLISQCCMCFELCFPISREIVRKQGYLDLLMNLPVADHRMASQLDTLRVEMKKARESV